MLVTVKISKPEYDAIKAVAKKRGQFISFHLNQAIRQYVERITKQKEQAA